MNRRRLLVAAAVVLAGTYLLAGSVGFFPGEQPDREIQTVDEPDPPLILLAGMGWLVGLGLPLFGYL